MTSAVPCRMLWQAFAWLRYSVYLLYRYKSTNTDAEGVAQRLVDAPPNIMNTDALLQECHKLAGLRVCVCVGGGSVSVSMRVCVVLCVCVCVSVCLF